MRSAEAQEKLNRHGFWERSLLSGPVALYVLDQLGNGLVATESALAQLGVTEGQFIGTPFIDFTRSCEAAELQERLDSLGDSLTSFELGLRCADGERVEVVAEARRDVLDDGTPVIVVTVQRTEAARSAEKTQERRESLERLIERIQHRFAHCTAAEVSSVIEWALGEVAVFLGADRGYVLAYDIEAGHESMTHEWVAAGIEAEKPTYRRVPLAFAPASTKQHYELEVIAVRDVSALDGEWAVDRSFFESGGLRSILELPIVMDGTAVGGIGFDWIRRQGDWADSDLLLLSMVASTCAQLLGREAAELELRRRSVHDDLTGLLNRIGFVSKVDTLRYGTAADELVAVITLDIDQFNSLNDSLGSAAGDALLRQVGARLRGLIRPGDVVARMNSDEFAVAMRGVGDEWAVSQTARRICDALAAPYALGNRTHMITVSCGIGTASGPNVPAEELLRRAATAMYRSRQNGQARVTLFDPTVEALVAERFELDQRLRVALERNEFEVHFQPEVDLATGDIVGAEALLRWRTDGELREAWSFVPVVEETGLIVPVGRWVLEEAVRNARRWCDWIGEDRFVMRVNVSPRQLEDDSFLDHVETTLRRAGLPPECLCLEITETALMRDADAATELLTRFDALGIQLAIDDFGTGYSSLAYLKHFPVDILKIDRSFVNLVANDPQDRAIVQTVINLALALGMDVTAEGIETPEQAATLVELGCPRGQGWLFSRAVEADALDDMVWELSVAQRV